MLEEHKSQPAMYARRDLSQSPKRVRKRPSPSRQPADEISGSLEQRRKLWLKRARRNMKSEQLLPSNRHRSLRKASSRHKDPASLHHAYTGNSIGPELQIKQGGVTKDNARTQRQRGSEKVYHPLDNERKEIRLLHLDPGLGDSLLRGTLKHASLADSPKPMYETISYVWGDQTLRAVINLDGYEADIPTSAEEVVRRMRHPDRPRVLWIDAICINQNDVRERGHQVEIMGEIYSNTFTNLIWLGEDDGNTFSALRSIDAIVGDIRRATKDYATLYETMFDKGLTLASRTGFSIDFAREPLLALLSRPWFSRLWVVQEVSLPSKSACYCGDFEIPLLDTLRVAAWLRYKRHFLPPTWVPVNVYPAHMFDYIDTFHGRVSRMPWTIVSLVHDLRVFKARDPRDHVYALLSLLKPRLNAEQASQLPIPDYTAPLAEVLHKITQLAILNTGDLHALNLLNQRPSPEGDICLPTWVPRWDLAINPSLGDTNLLYNKDSADNWERCQLKGLESKQLVLTAHGIVIGHVQQTIKCPDRTYGVKESQEFFRDIEHLANRGLTESLEVTEQKIAVTLVAGEYINEDIHKAELESGASYSALKRWLLMTNMFPAESNASGGIAQAAVRFYHDVGRCCTNRSIFQISGGYIGMGPEVMRHGDIVVVLYGCRNPVILRQSASAADEYEVIGVSYVYGIMQGEAVRLHRARGDADVVFRLR